MKTFQKFSPRHQVLFALSLTALLVLSVQSSPAAETGAEIIPAASETNDTLRASLELQEQLHASQLALKQNREERAALEKEVAARLKILEEAVNSKNSTEVDAMKVKVEALRNDLASNNRLLLIVGGGIAAVGFFVLLATGYLQWRSVNRLAEFSTLIQSARAALPAPASSAEGQLLGAGVTAQSNGRLFGALTDLEKRILELEHTTHATSEANALTAGTGTTGSEASGLTGENGHGVPAHDSLLLAKGQSLLNMDKPTEALACFEEILQTEPNHGEALVKKGIALEELEQPEEAIRCYDRAIAANADLTIAYLQKGGLFNRLERYEEALQCYEQALHAQEKAHQA